MTDNEFKKNNERTAERDVLEKELIHPELSYSIIGAAMEVHRVLGPGWDEWDYHRAMITALENRGHRVDSHLREDIVHMSEVADQYELDLLVDDLVILELKHLRSGFHSSHYEQILNYLKRWDKRLGILINFGLQSLAFERIPFDSCSACLYTSGRWDDFCALAPEVFSMIKKTLGDILADVGYGYGVKTFKNILVIALRKRGFVIEPLILDPTYSNVALGAREVDCIQVDARILISVTAVGTQSSARDMAYIKSYMRSASINQGLLIDIGKPQVQLRGVV